MLKIQSTENGTKYTPTSNRTEITVSFKHNGVFNREEMLYIDKYWMYGIEYKYLLKLAKYYNINYFDKIKIRKYRYECQDVIQIILTKDEYETEKA